MLESLEQNNIKRMAVETPEKAEFDIEIEFTKEDWEAAVNDIHKILYSGMVGGLGFALEEAIRLRKIKPDLDLKFAEPDILNLKEALKTHDKPEEYANYVILADQIRTLFGDEIAAEITQEHIKGANDNLKDCLIHKYSFGGYAPVTEIIYHMRKLGLPIEPNLEKEAMGFLQEQQIPEDMNEVWNNVAPVVKWKYLFPDISWQNPTARREKLIEYVRGHDNWGQKLQYLEELLEFGMLQPDLGQNHTEMPEQKQF